MKKSPNEICCYISCDAPLDASYWNNQYIGQVTGWDLGIVSPPIKAYIDQLNNKNIRILIPGCGNAYEAAYLLQQGFTNITLIDLSPALVEKLKVIYQSNPHIKVLQGDFFEHKGTYDLIIEQTFFCAINPALREKYVAKMKELLSPSGKLMGLLFNRSFEQKGPPFGGSKCQYTPLFEHVFDFKYFEKCYNSYEKRKDTELFLLMTKKL